MTDIGVQNMTEAIRDCVADHFFWRTDEADTAAGTFETTTNEGADKGTFRVTVERVA